MTEESEYPDYQCPFCLYENKMWYFSTKKKNGKEGLMKQCPNCSCKFRPRNLFKSSELTPDSYAKWIVEYPYQEFWHRIRFDDWKKKMKEICGSFGFSQFWDRYHHWRDEHPTIERPMTQDSIDSMYAQYLKTSTINE